MEKINSAVGLRAAIELLEIKQEQEGLILKEQFRVAYESMKPINLIKSTFKQVVASPEIKDNVLSTSVGLGAGYLSKLLVAGVTHSPLRMLLGYALQYGVTKVIAKNPEAVKSVGKGLVNIIRNISKKKKVDEDEDETTG